MKVVIAVTVFVVIAVISIIDAAYWKNQTNIWLGVLKTVLAIMLSYFTIRGSVGARRTIIAWSSVGAVAMGVSIFQIGNLTTLQSGISKPVLMMGLVVVLFAYVAIVALLLLGSQERKQEEFKLDAQRE